MKKQMMSILCAAAVSLSCINIPAAFAEAETTITLSGSQTAIEGSGAQISEQMVLIHEAGQYTLHGEYNGQVYIEADEEAEITLILDQAQITNPNGPAILVKSAGKITLHLQKGTKNLLTSGTESMTVVTADDESASAAVQAKCDLKINGSGTLEVYGYLDQGIRTTKDLKINNGTITVIATGTGIRCKDDLEIKGGEITITSGGDGISAGKSASEEKDTEADGSFIMEDGSLHIISGGDAIASKADLTIAGGSLSAVTGGGSSAAVIKVNDNRGGLRGGYINPATEQNTPSTKGLKADGLLIISGGEVSLDACDDALHAAGNVLISGGSLVLSTGDDGIHSDENVSISDGSIHILNSYEGVEGQVIEISGGSVNIISMDDGINASNGSGNMFGFGGGFEKDFTGSRGGRGGFIAPSAPFDPFVSFDPSSSSDPPAPYSPDNQSVTEAEPYVLPLLHISGGEVYVQSSGDGLDSNGNLLISGGLVIVDGPENSMNGALDSGSESGGTLVITGGTALAIGASGMAECFGNTSTQPFINVSARFVSGDEIVISDAQGNVLLRHTAAQSGQSIIFSCDSMQSGDTVTVTCAGSTIQALAGTESSGYGGFGGGFGGGRGGNGGFGGHGW